MEIDKELADIIKRALPYDSCPVREANNKTRRLRLEDDILDYLETEKEKWVLQSASIQNGKNNLQTEGDVVHAEN
jgi:hypothetical protein